MKSASGFNGQRFFNSYAAAIPLKQIGKWLLSRQTPAWPKSVFQSITFDNMTWFHHSTCSIKMSGFHMLTDPIWEKACGPFGRFGPKRHGALQTKLEDLDPVDIVLVSHNHFDHMCLKTLHRLQKMFNPLIITGLGNKRHLKDFPLVKELDWWESYSNAHLSITYVPAAHFSSRSPFDRNKSLWGGFVLEGEKKVYFAADTGQGNHFQEIADAFAPFDYCFLPIGSYKPESILHPVHIGPREAVALHKLLGAQKSIPIHYGTFQLGDEGFHEPLQELAKELRLQGCPDNSFLFPSYLS